MYGFPNLPYSGNNRVYYIPFFHLTLVETVYLNICICLFRANREYLMHHFAVHVHRSYQNSRRQNSRKTRPGEVDREGREDVGCA